MFGERRIQNELRLESIEVQILESQKALQIQIDDLKHHCKTQMQSIQSLDKKLQYLCVAADGEFAEVRQSLAQIDRSLSQKLEVLEVDVQRQQRLVKLGLKKIRQTLSEEQKQREYRLIEELYHSYHKILETKISKHELSELLLEICRHLEKGQTLEEGGRTSLK